MFRKILSFVIGLAIVCLFVYSAYTEGYLDNTPMYDVLYTVTHITDEKIPSPVSESEFATFMPTETIGITCGGKSATVSGIMQSARDKWVVVTVELAGGAQFSQTSFQAPIGTPFSHTVELPENGTTATVNVYTNSDRSGTFTSRVLDYFNIEFTGGGWQMITSPVLEHNTEMYTRPKPRAASLKATKNIQSDNISIKTTAARVVEDCQSDYDKALEIHDYICKNFYYDKEMASRDVIAVESAAEVMLSHTGVCSGFANVYAAMCRSVGLPCAVVTGVALGDSMGISEWTEEVMNKKYANHAWNEVYVDGRWMIVDTTWDCLNVFENNQKISKNDISHLYFDANLRYFSTNHKILKYKDI